MSDKYTEHICQYCGALTNQSDEDCFKKPPEAKKEIQAGYQLIDFMFMADGSAWSFPPEGFIKKGHGSLKEYEIWMEGYSATGESGQAQFCGKYKARSFREACDIHFFTEYLAEVKKQQIEMPEYPPTHASWAKDLLYYDREKLTYWACRLFDNETDARKSYG